MPADKNVGVSVELSVERFFIITIMVVTQAKGERQLTLRHTHTHTHTHHTATSSVADNGWLAEQRNAMGLHYYYWFPFPCSSFVEESRRGGGMSWRWRWRCLWHTAAARYCSQSKQIEASSSTTTTKVHWLGLANCLPIGWPGWRR